MISALTGDCPLRVALSRPFRFEGAGPLPCPARNRFPLEVSPNFGLDRAAPDKGLSMGSKADASDPGGAKKGAAQAVTCRVRPNDGTYNHVPWGSSNVGVEKRQNARLLFASDSGAGTKLQMTCPIRDPDCVITQGGQRVSRFLGFEAATFAHDPV